LALAASGSCLSFQDVLKNCFRCPSERALYSSNRCVGLKQIALVLVAAPPRFRERKLHEGQISRALANVLQNAPRERVA
jgi:hypothetical protein